LASGNKGQSRAGYYVHIEKGASFIAGGFYAPLDDLKKSSQRNSLFHD
jgi:hypothetical protein